MIKITYAELKKIFQTHEATYPSEHLTAHIVFSESSFNRLYSLDSRTYVVSSNNKAYQPNKNGYSIFGNALDGSDPGVRLDHYMADEHGGKNGWKVDYCFQVKGDGNYA